MATLSAHLDFHQGQMPYLVSETNFVASEENLHCAIVLGICTSQNAGRLHFGVALVCKRTSCMFFTVYIFRAYSYVENKQQWFGSDIRPPVIDYFPKTAHTVWVYCASVMMLIWNYFSRKQKKKTQMDKNCWDRIPSVTMCMHCKLKKSKYANKGLHKEEHMEAIYIIVF